MLLEKAEDLYKKIEEKSGKSLEEVRELVEKKRQKFSGLLTESGAAFLVAKEAGIDLGFEEKTEAASISSLESGMNNVDLQVKLVQAYQKKRFEKNGRKGTIQNLLVADDTGTVRLTLWNKTAEEFEEQKIQKDSLLFLKNCVVSEYNQRKQLQLSYNGKMSVKKKAEGTGTKIKDLKEGMNSVDVFAKIAVVYPLKEFEKDGRKGKLANFEIVDESGRVRATAWNDIVEEVEKLEVGTTVKIENAYTKKGLNGTELHLGFQTRILKEPGKEVEAKVESRKERGLYLEEGKFIEAKVIVLDLLKGRLVFYSCSKCRAKVERTEESFLCQECGKVEGKAKAVISTIVSDGEKTAKASFFGEKAEMLLEEKAEEIEKKLKETTAEGVVEEAKEKTLGKEIVLQGKVKTNRVTGEKEISVRQYNEVNQKQETKNLIKELLHN